MVKKIGNENVSESDDIIIDGDYEDVSEAEADLDEQLDAIFADIGGNDDIDEFVVKAYRTQPGKGKLGYLFTCLPSELPIMDRLRDDYGSGDFQIRVLKKNRIYKRRNVCVEAPVKKEKPVFDESQKLNGLVEVMAGGFTRLGELIVQRDQQQTQSPTSMKEMVETMILMKELNGPPPEPVSPFQQIKDVLSIQKSLSGKDGSAETNVNDVLLTLAENVLPKLAEAGAVSPENKERPRVIPEDITETTEAQKTINLEKIENPEKGNPMKGHLMFLCMQASLKKSPALYAEVVLDNTPDEKLDELVTAMNGEDAMDKLIALHPPVAKHKAWFLELSKEIMNNIQEVEETLPDEPLQNETEPTKTGDNVSGKKDNGNIIEHS